MPQRINALELKVDFCLDVSVWSNKSILKSGVANNCGDAESRNQHETEFVTFDTTAWKQNAAAKKSWNDYF